jgi:tetratricopeptide (TPR) repeat protein
MCEIPDGPVTEKEIEAVESLSASSECSAALNLAQRLLLRDLEAGLRMRLLFTIVFCAATLDQPDLVEAAMSEFEKLPDSDRTRALANLNRAYAEIDLGRPKNALNILDMCLATGLFEADDMKIHKYRLCFLKGKALTRLRYAAEALEWLDNAHSLFPVIERARNVDEKGIFGWVEPSLQLERANCFMCLDRFEDSYRAAEEALNHDSGDLAAFALQYMAECRVWQKRVPEALALYSQLKKHLPNRLVDEERIQTGITNCMSYLEKLGSASRPS